MRKPAPPISLRYLGLPATPGAGPSVAFSGDKGRQGSQRVSRLSQRVLMIWLSGEPSHQREGQNLHCRAAWVGGLPSRAACKMLSVTERTALRVSDDTEGKPLGMKRRAA